MVASIMGWSASTTVRMAQRYGHISTEARREAMEAANAARSPQSRSVFDRETGAAAIDDAIH